MLRKTNTRTVKTAFGTLAGAALVSALMMAEPPAAALMTTVEPTQRVDARVLEQLKHARALQKLKQWEEAYEIIRSLAAEGHPTALYHLGRALKSGHGVDPDPHAAKEAFKRAVSYDFAERGAAAYELGRLYQRATGPGCMTMAFQWFLKSLEFGHDKAHVQLAKHYERGLGVAVSYEAASGHYEQAAIFGYPTATIQLARLLNEGGSGFAQNPRMAQYWFARARDGLISKANSGSASAAKTLGRLYLRGEFQDPDLDQAQRWFVRSAELGDAGAMHELGLMLTRNAKSTEAAQEGIDWLNQAIALSHGGAMTDLARLHLKERFGLERPDAVALLEDGVEVGHPGSMAELGRLHFKGDLVPRDLARARELAERGAAQRHQGARALLKQLDTQHAALTVTEVAAATA